MHRLSAFAAAGTLGASALLAIAPAAASPSPAHAKHRHHHGGKRRYDTTFTGTETQETQQTCPEQFEHSTITRKWDFHSTSGQQIVATRHSVDADVQADGMEGSSTEHTVYTNSARPENNFDETDPNAKVNGAIRDGLNVTDGKHAIGAQDVDFTAFAGLPDDEIPIPMKLKNLKRSYTLPVSGHAPGPEIDFGCTGTSTRTFNATWDVNQVSRH